MSQAKVDQNKKNKANRKSILRKKKIEYALSIACVCVILVAVVGWIGYSIYTKAATAASENIEYSYYELSTSAISDYTSTLN